MIQTMIAATSGSVSNKDFSSNYTFRESIVQESGVAMTARGKRTSLWPWERAYVVWLAAIVCDMFKYWVYSV